MAKKDAKGPNEENDPKSIAEKIVRKLGAEFQLDDVDKAVIAVMNRFPGATTEQLAQTIGYSTSGMSKRINRPAFKQAMEEMKKGVLELLVDVQVSALRKLKKIIESDPDVANVLQATRQALMPLGRNEAQSPMQQNLVFSVRFGDDGQLFKDVRVMKPEDQLVNPRKIAQRVIDVSAK